MSELKKMVLLFGMMLLMVACGGKSSGSGDSGSKELNIYTWTYFYTAGNNRQFSEGNWNKGKFELL